MPDFGIGEAIAAFSGADILGALGFGGGEAAAAGAAGLGAADAGLAAAGPTALGTAFDFLAPGAAADISALSAVGPTVGGTIADTLAPGVAAGIGGTAFGAAPLAESGVFSTGAAPVFDTGGLSSVAGGVAPGGAFDSALPANATPTSGTLPGATGGTPSSNVFTTGTGPVQASPSVAPGGGAAGLSAPSGVTAPVDATATVPGATGATSVGGAPLNQAPSSIDSLLGKAGTGIMDSLTKNPLGVALGAGGLGYNIFEGQKNTKNQQALAADAQTATANSNQMVASGEALQQYLANGTLPPAYQTQVDQAIQDAKTTAISNAAAQGLSTDPTQNTALAATLAKIDASRGAMQTQVASQLFQSGSSLVGAGQSAAGLSGQLYQALVANDTTQAANTGKAIATLAAALNGKSNNTIGGTNIQLSQG
jgi:hypothetical protein